MVKVFVSGSVIDATLRGPIPGISVQANIVHDSEKHVLWRGTTDANGAFGFELRPIDYPMARNLVAEVHQGETRLAEAEVAWHTLERTGTHIDFAIVQHAPKAQGKPFSLPFPIGFPGADRPPGQRGPVQVELERPKMIPTHPIAALPFLLQRSRPTDPDEAMVRRLSTSDPP